MAYFGHRSAWQGGTKNMGASMSMGEIIPPSRNSLPTRPFRGTVPSAGSGLQRLVPSGSAGGPARVPNTSTPRSGNTAGLLRNLRGMIGAGNLAAARQLLKRFPYLNAMLTLMELLSLFETDMEFGIYEPEVPAGYDMSGWTLTCATPPNPAETQPKMGITPTPPGQSPNVNFPGCNVSTTNTANAPFGFTIPVGSTAVQFVTSGAAWPNRNGRVNSRYSFPGGSPNAVVYRPNPTAAVIGPVYSDEPYLTTGRTTEVTLGGGFEPWTEFVPGYFEPAIEFEIVVHPDTGVGTDPRDLTGTGTGPTVGSNPGVDTGTTSPPNTPVGVEVTNPGPGWHLNVPDESVKWRLGGRWLQRLGNLYGAFTEWEDAMDCLNKALPGMPCPKSMSLHERTACILSRLGQVDPGAAETCMAENNAKDFAIGKWSRMGSDAFGKRGREGWHGRPVGPGFGGWGARMHRM